MEYQSKFYIEFNKQDWNNRQLKVIPNNEALSYLINMNIKLLPAIEDNYFDIYVRYYTKTLTDAKTFYWYCNLRVHLKLQLFTSFSLEEVSILLNIPKKRIANFTKFMKDLTPYQRVHGYTNWYNHYTQNILTK